MVTDGFKTQLSKRDMNFQGHIHDFSISLFETVMLI